jgi:hypothetical protein
MAGRSEREPLLQALGDGVFALHEDAELEGKKCLILEVTAPDLGPYPSLSEISAVHLLRSILRDLHCTPKCSILNHVVQDPGPAARPSLNAKG